MFAGRVKIVSHSCRTSAILKYFLSSASTIGNFYKVDVLKFLTLVACQKGYLQTALIKIRLLLKSSLSRVFTVCFSDKTFVNSNPPADSHHFILDLRVRFSKL